VVVCLVLLCVLLVHRRRVRRNRMEMTALTPDPLTLPPLSQQRVISPRPAFGSRNSRKPVHGIEAALSPSDFARPYSGINDMKSPISSEGHDPRQTEASESPTVVSASPNGITVTPAFVEESERLRAENQWLRVQYESDMALGLESPPSYPGSDNGSIHPERTG